MQSVDVGRKLRCARVHPHTESDSRAVVIKSCTGDSKSRNAHEIANEDTSAPNLYFVHADHLYRPIKMTDGTETIVWDAVYKPFGDAYSITGTAANNLRFPGQYFLMEEGLHYNWYRHYDATIGRYLQTDPLDGISIGLSSVATYLSDTIDRKSSVESSMLDDLSVSFGSFVILPVGKSQAAFLGTRQDSGNVSAEALSTAGTPSLYGYGAESPTTTTDFKGLIASPGGGSTPIKRPQAVCQVYYLCGLVGISLESGPGLIPSTTCHYEGYGGRTGRLEFSGHVECPSRIQC